LFFFPVQIPFLKDYGGEQLGLWAAENPTGANRRTTSSAGNPLASNTASLALSSRGPLFMDSDLVSKLASFNRERIPERVAHAKGQGAFGTFTVTYDVSRITKAKVFSRVGKSTKMLVRFSATTGGSSSADTLHDNRGFALRFYTEDGNLDFPGCSIEAFNIRDPMLFPDLIRSQKKNPQTHVEDPNQFFDFFSLRPELIHNYIRLQADHGRPGSVRAINGSSINAYRCINAQGEMSYCKFWWESWQKIPPLGELDAIALAGTDPDFYTKDLYNSIAQGNYPKWTFGVQVITDEQAESLPFNPLDATKVWRFEDFPFYPIGVFTLDKNPTNFFVQIEQAAFCPSNLVPGVGMSNDRILMARAVAYKDAQRHRLGPNFDLIEVNRPLSRVDSYERDGVMRISSSDNGDGGPVYFPNSFNGPRIDPETVVGHVKATGYIARIDSGNDDNFTQARQFLDLDVGREERSRIALRIAAELADLVPSVRTRVLLNCIYPLGKDFAEAVVRSLQTLELSHHHSNSTNFIYQ